MPTEKTDVSWLWDMLDAANAVTEFIAGNSFSDYAADRMLRSAVERQIEIIGEAARRVSAEFQAAHAAIPWRPIIGQCHVLAHEYGELRHDLLWRVATVHIPELVAALTPLIPLSPDLEQPTSSAEQPTNAEPE